VVKRGVTHEIPCLDFFAVDSEEFAGDLRRAFSEYGFIALKNHGLDPALRERAFGVIEAFFSLGEEEKRRYFVEGGGGARGYTPFGVEVAKDESAPDLKEFFHVGRELTNSNLPKNIFPEEVAGFRDTLLELYRHIELIGDGVLSAVARCLGLAPEFFRDKTQRGNSLLRALHYPPLQGESGGAVRAAAHEDINLITLLVGSEQPGLEVLSKSGDWVKAPGGDELLLCNVGDMLQRLTNHVLSSTTHRVVNPEPPWCDVSRYSVPFFLHPNSDFLIETLPGCVSAERANRYPTPILADDYLTERLREIGLLD